MTSTCDICGSTDVDPQTAPYDANAWYGGHYVIWGRVGSTAGVEGAIVTQTLCREHKVAHMEAAYGPTVTVEVDGRPENGYECPAHGEWHPY